MTYADYLHVSFFTREAVLLCNPKPLSVVNVTANNCQQGIVYAYGYLHSSRVGEVLAYLLKWSRLACQTQHRLYRCMAANQSLVLMVYIPLPLAVMSDVGAGGGEKGQPGMVKSWLILLLLPVSHGRFKFLISSMADQKLAERRKDINDET